MIEIKKKPLTFITVIIILLCLNSCFSNDAKECESLFQDNNKKSLAYAYCERAANQGNPQSQQLFAQLLLTDNKIKEAINYFQKSANQGNPEALFKLAELYDSKTHTDHDSEKALFYYNESCKRSFLQACQKIESLKNLEKSKQLENEKKQLEKIKIELLEQKNNFDNEKKKIEQEKENIESQKKEIERISQINNLIEAPISQSDIKQAFSDLISEIKNGRDGLVNYTVWVNNCYKKSNNKKGCLYFDVLVNIIFKDYLSSEDFFLKEKIINRASKNIKEYNSLTDEQLNILFNNIKKHLLVNMDTLNEMYTNYSYKNPSKNNINTSHLKFYDGLATFQDGNLYGYVDQQGRIIIPAQFSYAGRFSHGRAAVQSPQNNLWGFIDTNGKYIIYPNYKCVGMFSEEEALAGVYQGGDLSNNICTGGKWGYMDIYGNWVINPVLDYAERFSKGKARVTYQGHTGFINRFGQWVN